MTRPTERASIEAPNEEAALGYFEAALSGLCDPRRAERQRYPLRIVVVSASMAIICNHNNTENNTE